MVSVAWASVVVIDSFDLGSTTLNSESVYSNTSTTDASINPLPGSDNTRYLNLDISYIDPISSIITPGSGTSTIILNKEGSYASSWFSYSAATGTYMDLSDFTAVNVLGSGTLSGNGGTNFYLEERGEIWFGYMEKTSGPLGNFVFELNALQLYVPLSRGDRILDLSQIRFMHWGLYLAPSENESSLTYEVSEINIVPEPATILLFCLGELLLRRKNKISCYRN